MLSRLMNLNSRDSADCLAPAIVWGLCGLIVAWFIQTGTTMVFSSLWIPFLATTILAFGVFMMKLVLEPSKNPRRPFAGGSKAFINSLLWALVAGQVVWIAYSVLRFL